MINGFVLEITNEKKEDVLVSLFNNELITAGVTIRAKNSNYDYKSLYIMAINEGFSGSGIMTDDDRICRINIYKDSIPTSFEFYKILGDQKIIIDGLFNYITLIIPQSSKLLLQLIPGFK